MNQTVNANRLFLASCFALITTAMTFGIRAEVLNDWKLAFDLTNEQVGYVNQMAFLAFTVAMIFGGPLYNIIGPKKIIWVAFAAHVLGLALTIFSNGYSMLMVATFIVGFANGTVEAACNPMISNMFEGNEKTKMLNRFHMWFPGGIVLATLVALVFTSIDFGWQLKVGAILLPTIVYAYLIFGQEFPAAKVEGSESTGSNFKEMFKPGYLFILVCMALTAISEFGPEQWSKVILEKSGASPMIILALITGLMAVGRYFAGPIVHKFNQAGVLLFSAIATTIGVYMFSVMQGEMLYVSAVVFAVGVCYFWPTMLGYVAENLPKTGALGLSIMGGMGMFSTSIFQPIIGKWIDNASYSAKQTGLVGDALEVAAGQATMAQMVLFPAILIVAFAGLYFFGKKASHA